MAKRDYFKLDVDAPLFEELSKRPTWWQQILKDKDLYVNVRKENRVFVYFRGAAVIKELHIGRDGMVGRIDKEYQKGWVVDRDSNHLFKVEEIVDNIKLIKDNIIDYYHGQAPKPELGSEKEIQGEYYINGEYLDTEFAFVDSDSEIIRIDLITVTKGGMIEFVELKRISDGRLLKEKGSSSSPEIIGQMEKYDEFIAGNAGRIKQYYENVQQAMEKIGVRNPLATRKIKGVAPNARLLFAPYLDGKEKHPKRIERVQRIEGLLKDNNITSNIDELLEMIKD